MSKLGKKEPRMDTDEHGCDFLEKLLDGAEVEWVALGEVATFLKGKSLPKKSIVEEGVHKCIHYGELFTYYPAIIKDVKSRTSQSITDSIVSLSNDVLMPTSDVTPTGLAVASCIREDNIVLGGDILVIRSSAIDGRFLSTFIRNNKSKIMQMVKGATVYHIYAKDLAKLSIPIPCPENPEKSLAIQAEIVRILDTFAELTTELTAELTARKKQYNYYRDQLLTFEEGEVEWKPLEEVATFRRGSFPQPYGNAEWYDGEGCMPFVQVADVANFGYTMHNITKQQISVLAQPKSIFVESGSVVVTLQGTIGRVAITQYDCYVDRTLAIFTSYKVKLNKKYFAHQLKAKFDKEKEFARGSTIKTITKAEFSKFEIPLPPINEQDRIVAILDKFDTLTHSISEGLPREIELRQKQYEYYRDLLLNFPKPQTEGVA